MGEACSHLSEEERQVIRIEVGNGTSVRKMARLPGRSPSSISREIRRNMWFPVQRERVLTAVPAEASEASEDGPVDGPLLHRRPRAAQGRPQARQTAQAPPACHANACRRGWPNGCVAAGRRRPSAAGRASCSPTTPPCACARRPSAVGSTPTAIAVNAGRAAFHVATGGVAGVAAGGRRVSRFPDGLPSPDVRRRPATAAVSAIGRPTA